VSQPNHNLAHLEKALSELGEHYDSAQIFATRHEAGTLGGTVRAALGCGNWYARYGQVQEWIVRQDEQTRISERSDDGAES